jgi:non-specific serine/threonine protein kinase
MTALGDDTPPGLRRPLGRWRIGLALLDEGLAAVSVDGVPVEIDRSSYDLLLALLRHAGEVVTKGELMEAGWPGRVVSENSLSKAMGRLRQALGHDGEAIRVVHGYGYRLCAPVRQETSPDATTTAHTPALQAGDALPLRPGWRLQQRLGEGSAGVIYRAVADGHAAVAVKFAHGEAGLRSLKREIALHRYIMASKGGLRDVAPVLSWNLTQAPYFLEMPYYPGGNLHDWALAQGGLRAVPIDERIALCAGLCETVARLHELGVLHKDLKPANLYPVVDADGPRLVLADLGVAEASTAPQLAELGLTLSLPMAADGRSPLAGSLLYVAPEVIAGELATQRSDVYSLGVILFQLCTGDLRSSLAPGWEQRIDDPLLREDIASAAALAPTLRPDARELGLRLRKLSKRKIARAEQSQREIALAMQAKALVSAQQRRRLWLTLSGGLALGLVATLWMYWQADAAHQQALAASSEKQAVVDFLTNDLLAQADPYQTDRSDMTVRAAVDNAAPKIDAAFDTQPDVAIALHKTLAQVYEGLGLYDRASQHYGLAMNLNARARNQTPRSYADLSIAQCSALRSAGDYAKATQACAQGNRLLAQQGLTSESARLNTGKLLFEEGRCREALAYLKPLRNERLVREPSHSWREHELVSDTMFFRALCLQQIGQARPARDAFEQSIAYRRVQFGSHSLYLAWALSDYGYFLAQNGEIAKATAALEESQAIFTRNLGPDNPERYGPNNGFALIRLFAKDWPAAIDFLEPIYVVERDSLGPSHVWTLMTLSELAWAKAEAGLGSSAAQDLDAAMRLAKPLLGNFGARSTFMVDRWILAALALKRNELARALIEQQQQLVTMLEPTHPRRAMLSCYRAELVRREPGHAPATVTDLATRCRTGLLQALPADHPLVKDANALLANATSPSRQ